MTSRRVSNSLALRSFSRLGEKVAAGRMRGPTQAASRRAGLAPLELVLSVPMLMMILSMMIIVGTAGSWKLRTLANSRQAAARSIWPRDGDNDPKPDSWWPASATMSFHSASPSLIESDPFSDHYVVRGPVVPSPTGGRPLEVQGDTLDMTLGLEAGFAEIDRDLPLWKQLPHRNHYSRDTLFFSGQQWQHGAMGISNNARRILVTYDYDLARFAGGTVGAMTQTANQLLSNPARPMMGILDREPELRGFYGDPYTPYSQDRYDELSFYPPASVGCDFDLRPRVDGLLVAIEDVPCRMARKYCEMYRLRLMIDPDDAQAKQHIAELNSFMSSLGCDEGCEEPPPPP